MMIDPQVQEYTVIPAESEKWEERCSEIASLLETLRKYVPARVIQPGSNSFKDPDSSAFPHILRTRTSKSTPDKALNRFIQGLADICAHDLRCDVFASAITASISPIQKSDSGSAGGHSESQSALRTRGAAQAELAGPMVNSGGSNTHRVYFSSNEGIEVLPEGPPMRAYIDHCLALLNMLHRIYVTDIRVKNPNSAFHDFKERMKIPVIAAFEREIALLVYRQCYRKVTGRIRKNFRAYHTAQHLYKLSQTHQRFPSPGAHSEDDQHGSPSTRTGASGKSPTDVDALWSIIPNLGLFISICDPGSVEYMEEEIRNQVHDLIMALGSEPPQNTGEAAIPDRPQGWIINDSDIVPSEDHLFLLYQNGLELSKVARQLRIKNWLRKWSQNYVELDENYYIKVERVLEKTAKISQAVENIVRYALRHSTSNSTPGVPWTLTSDFLPPIKPPTMPCITMNGERLLQLYTNYSYHLKHSDKGELKIWGEQFRKDRTETWVRNSTVHAEVNLVARLILNGPEAADGVYPFIGCTKLSCYPCDMYFKALRKVGNYEFHTQGGHEKIYGKQWYPAPLDSEGSKSLGPKPKSLRHTIPVIEHMIKDVLHDIWCVQKTEIANSLSDSTGESGGGSGSEE